MGNRKNLCCHTPFWQWISYRFFSVSTFGSIDFGDYRYSAYVFWQKGFFMTEAIRQTLTRKRCVNHSHREAAAKCPECNKFYCRECVTEHENKVLCATCLASDFSENKDKSINLKFLKHILIFLFSFLLLWLLYYYFGQLLLTISPDVHEGYFWEKLW